MWYTVIYINKKLSRCWDSTTCEPLDAIESAKLLIFPYAVSQDITVWVSFSRQKPRHQSILLCPDLHFLLQYVITIQRCPIISWLNKKQNELQVSYTRLQNYMTGASQYVSKSGFLNWISPSELAASAQRSSKGDSSGTYLMRDSRSRSAGCWVNQWQYSLRLQPNDYTHTGRHSDTSIRNQMLISNVCTTNWNVLVLRYSVRQTCIANSELRSSSWPTSGYRRQQVSGSIHCSASTWASRISIYVFNLSNPCWQSYKSGNLTWFSINHYGCIHVSY